MSFNSPTLGLVDADRIENDLTGPELVVVYNQMGTGSKVKRFSDRTAGIRRVKGALVALSCRVPTAIDKKPQDAVVSTQPVKIKKKDLPLTGTSRIELLATGSIKPHRPNTRRGKLIRLMEREEGASLDEMASVSQWSVPEVRSILKMINSGLGHGVSEDPEGKIHIVGTPKDRKPFNLTALENIKNHRPKTKRAKVIAMLSEEGGTTVAAVREVTGWNEAQAYQGIILVNKYVGHGLSEDDQGNIRIC